MTTFGSDLILARLQSLHPKSIDLSLARLERLLERLGHPERQVPPVVHIAGTNGKGSTLAMLDAMLSASGARVHRYISPHLVHFNERILIHGQPIAERFLAEVLDACERANADEPITFFEITTAAAFLAYARTPADWLLLETGLGGRLDATNVVDQPALTLISPISMDHESYLGTTLAAIAGEKAGIIKPGVPVIAGPQEPAAAAVLTARSTALAATLSACDRDWFIHDKPPGFRLEAARFSIDLPRPKLEGAHQVMNAALAAMAAKALGLQEAAIGRGITDAEWAARLQRLDTPADAAADRAVGSGTKAAGGRRHPSSHPFELWLDGGHNPAAGVALAASLPGIAGNRSIDLVVGMLDTKDAAAFLAPMRDHVRRVFAVPVPDEPASQDPAQIAAVAESLGLVAHASDGVDQALEMIAARADPPGLVLICGSLYLAGHVLRQLEHTRGS